MSYKFDRPKTIEEIPTPALIVRTDILRRNILRNQAHAAQHNVNLRPHAKTHKTVEIAKMQIDAGARGLTVATPMEAEVMSEVTDDIFVASPFGDSEPYRRLRALAEQGTKLTLGISSVRQAAIIGQIFGQEMPPIMVELNTGHRRYGYRISEIGLPRALRAVKELHRHLKDHLVGGYTHEGHVYRRIKSPREVAEEARDMMLRFQEKCHEAGIPMNILSVGSTPTFRHLENPDGKLSEVRPGVAVFNDYTQVKMGIVDVRDCALRVLATVNERRQRSMVTDCGSKCISSSGIPHEVGGSRGYGRVFTDLHSDELIPKVSYGGAGLSEEAGKAGTTRFKEGNKVLILPNHACPTVAENDFIYLVDEKRNVVDILRIAARGRIPLDAYSTNR